jgi:hypothetical protein
MPLDPNIEYYDIEVNETNIDRYNMEERFNQPRTELLSRAYEARKPVEGAPAGFSLSVKIPKTEVDAIDKAGEFNVFENFRDEHLDAGRIRHCGYEQRELEEGGFAYVCIIHGKISNYDVENRPTAPCIQVDPDVKPTKEQIRQTMQEALGCRYERKLDGIRGTVYTCIIHDRESKHDISTTPNAACLAVDPLTPGDGDPHR